LNIKTYTAVDSFDEAYRLLKKSKKNKILGGGAWLKLSIKEVDHLISLEKLSLDQIQVNKDYLEIGALASLRDIEINKDILSLDGGILSQAISNIMGITIRNLATIGGSVMGRFSFSDILPALMVMDVELVFHHHKIVDLKTFLSSRDYLLDVLKYIRIKKQDRRSFFKKVSNTPLDFSIINMAITKGDRFNIAIGSQPGLVMLLEETMGFLNKQVKITDQIIEEACDIAIKESNLGNNIRASKAYRETLVRTYLKRGIKQVTS